MGVPCPICSHWYIRLTAVTTTSQLQKERLTNTLYLAVSPMNEWCEKHVLFDHVKVRHNFFCCLYVRYFLLCLFKRVVFFSRSFCTERKNDRIFIESLAISRCTWSFVKNLQFPNLKQKTTHLLASQLFGDWRLGVRKDKL